LLSFGCLDGAVVPPVVFSTNRALSAPEGIERNMRGFCVLESLKEPPRHALYAGPLNEAGNYIQ
jgi:hypothetical protein